MSTKSAPPHPEFPVPDTDSPLPDTNLELTREFWTAAAREELVIPRCGGCGRWNWYPSEQCPGCGDTDLPWTAVSGRGTLFSWAVVRRAFVEPFAEKVPYVTGLVALNEDPAVRLVASIVECPPDRLQVDMPLRVVFRPLSFSEVSREVVAPMFTPAV